MKYGVDAIPYRASQLWQQVSVDTHEVASLALFKNRIKSSKCEDCPCRSFINIYSKCWVYLIRAH